VSEPGSEPWRRAEAARLIDFGRGAALPGGGFGWLDDQGRIDETKPCPLYLNARMTHVFALAQLSGADGTDGAQALAASGLQALATRFADREHGGWFASLDLSGQVTDATKMNYAHAHVLLAAASATAAGIPDAADLLATAGDTIERYFWSDAEGCARESWDAGFTASEPYRGANSNMHSVEAYLAAGDVTGDPAWHARAASIATRLIDGYARASSWRVPEHFDGNWQPLPDYNADRRNDQFRPYGTTPGHSFEWARLLLDLQAAHAAQATREAARATAVTAQAGAGEAGAEQPGPLGWLPEAAAALFDTAVADAEDRDGHPGLLYTVGTDGQPVMTARLHWVACEAVLAADALYRRTGEERFAAAAARWWDEIDRYFIDRSGGSWWHELTPEFTPAGSTWSGKPDLYHAYQAVLFPSLPLSPVAAIALAGRDAGREAGRPDQAPA